MVSYPEVISYFSQCIKLRCKQLDICCFSTSHISNYSVSRSFLVRWVICLESFKCIPHLFNGDLTVAWTRLLIVGYCFLQEFPCSKLFDSHNRFFYFRREWTIFNNTLDLPIIV